jgi:hypothetical protein
LLKNLVSDGKTVVENFDKCSGSSVKILSAKSSLPSRPTYFEFLQRWSPLARMLEQSERIKEVKEVKEENVKEVGE